MAPTLDTLIWAGGGIATLALAAVALALLARLGGCPGGRAGAAIVGGVLAGILLGPGVAGRVAPDTWTRAFEGGIEQRRALDEVRRAHDREIAAVEAVDVTPIYVQELEARHDQEIRPLREALDGALEDHRRLLGGATGAVGAASMLLAGAIAGACWRAGARRAPARPDEPGSPPARRTPDWHLADAIGASGFVVVLGLLAPALAVAWIAGAPAPVALGVGLCMGVLAIGAEVPARLAPLAALATLLGGAAVGWLAWSAAGGVRTTGWIVGAGVLATVALSAAGGVRLARAPRRVTRFACVTVGLSTVGALATIRCDPAGVLGSVGFWVVGVAAVLLSSDARWAGAGWAQRLFPHAAGMERPGAQAWTGAGAIVNAGTGMAQLLAGVVLHDAGVLPAEMLAGLILGAVAIELSRGLRRRVGWMLDGRELFLDDERR